MFPQYSDVMILRDDPESGIKAGSAGVIVEVYTQPSEGYIVEFMNGRGETLALLTLKAGDIKTIK